jgi:hypothetical protein
MTRYYHPLIKSCTTSIPQTSFSCLFFTRRENTLSEHILSTASLSVAMPSMGKICVSSITYDENPENKRLSFLWVFKAFNYFLASLKPRKIITNLVRPPVFRTQFWATPKVNHTCIELEPFSMKILLSILLKSFIISTFEYSTFG